MIFIARIFEAWRDARIFKAPTEPRGKLWHLFKYPQYGLLILSSLTYFLIIHEFVFHFLGLFVHLLLTAGVVLVDVVVAYFVFEFFLKFFRARELNRRLMLKVLDEDKQNMGSGS